MEAELQIENYKLFRKDRDRVKSKYGRSSGGVAHYIRENIAPIFEHLLEFSNGVNEALMFFSRKFNILLCVLYRQPTNATHKSDAPEFMELTSSIKAKIDSIQGCSPDLYICGDFNIPHVPSDDTSEPALSCNKQLLNILSDFTTHLNINQIIHKSTHRDGNILDFLFTNNTDSIFN